MGVRGLSTYLSHRENFFEDLELKDTRVIIDGNNLRFALYKWCPGLNHCFGGDYDKYYRYVKQFFSLLLSCGVTPSIVFDGGYDKSDQKLATIMHRLSDQTKNAVACNSVSQSKLQVFPIFGKEVFMEVLRDLDIDVRQCSYEADEVIAQLAMKEKCPVISNDSDFYIFNVQFISLDSLELDRLDQEKSISCKIFNREKMLSYYGLYSQDLLHLFASLMGNDYIPPQVFEKIFMNIKLPKKTKDASERHRKIKGLLLYLSKEKCAKQALSKLLGYFQENERLKLKEKVLHSVNIYNGTIECDIVSPEFSSHEDNSLPPWFVSEYHSANLPNWLLAVVANRKYFLPTQVEQKDKTSVHLDCIEIHQVLVNILTSVDTNCDSVKIYARVKSSVSLFESLESSNSMCALALNNVRTKSIEERRTILKNILAPTMSEEHLSNVPEGFKLFAMVLDYWCCKSKVSLVEIQSVLLCHFALTQIDPKTGAMRNSKKLQKLAEENVSVNKEYFQAALKVSPFFHIDEIMKTSTRKFEIGVVHSLSKLQAIIFASTALNSLLGNVYNFPKISDIFNGTFIFNAILQFLKKPYNEDFLPPGVAQAFNSLPKAITNCLTNLSTHSSVLSPKKKTKKSAKPSESEIYAAVPTEKDEQFHDVENIFSSLSLE
eukprot:GFUD01002209.1.p1 GENE.GFUD01002209.1~~GFUD01002209.1.p1  ORF type:complete len:659 (-),score=134.82 GFUD01002209.1:7-1983(-)